MFSRRLSALASFARVTRSRASVHPQSPSSYLALDRLLISTSTRTMSVFNTSRLLGKTVLITGASAGIGAVRLRSYLTRHTW